MARGYGFVAALALSLISSAALAQERQVREYEDNGVRYRETRETILRPVTEVHYENRERTVYREEVNTEMREIERTVHVPVTEYCWEPFVVNRFRLFRRPYVAYRQVPRTWIETRTEIVERPVTSRQLVPEKRTARVPVVTRRMAEEEVIRRVAISPRTRVLTSGRLAERMDIGGRRVFNDPPRYGTSIVRGVWTRGRY